MILSIDLCDLQDYSNRKLAMSLKKKPKLYFSLRCATAGEKLAKTFERTVYLRTILQLNMK